MNRKDDVTPMQKDGASTDILEKINLPSAQEAQLHFEIVKKRLLNVSNWNQITKNSPSDFTLVGPDGSEAFRDVREGDFFKISIPAPGPAAGRGYDWVKVYSIQNETDSSKDSEYLAVTVKPAKAPLSKEAAPAHFFNSEASSTFVVTRKGTLITAEVHGRNENPNTEKTGISDTVRNTIVALGAMLGFSDIQWKALVKGLISKD